MNNDNAPRPDKRNTLPAEKPFDTITTPAREYDQFIDQ